MERQAGGDLDTGLYHPGEFQGWGGLVGDPRHQRRAPGHRLRLSGAVLRDGRRQDLRQLCRGKVFVENISMVRYLPLVASVR